MFTDDIKTAFRWYTVRERRQEYSLHCKEVCDYKLITFPTALLPFQIMRAKSSVAISTWSVFDMDGVLVASLPVGFLNKKTVGDYNWFIYNGEPLTYLQLPTGFYYSEITDGTNTWYSEKFFVIDSLSGVNLFSVSWTGSNWSGNCATAGFTTPRTQTVLTVGKTYNWIITISAMTAGTCTLRMGSGGDSLVISANGSYSFTGTCSGNGIAYIERTAAFDGCMSAWGIQEVLVDESCYTWIEWSNHCRVGLTQYQTVNDVPIFKNRLYLGHTEVWQGEPKITEEGKENGDRRFIPTYQKLQIVYKIDTELIPQYVWESLFALRLHDTVTIHLNQFKGALDARDIEVAINAYEFDEKCFATGKIEFVGHEITKNSCCEEEDGCVQPCMTALPDTGVYVAGQKYMNSDGRIKERQSNGDFVYFTCESTMVNNAIDGLTYVFRGGTWYISPSVVSETYEDNTFTVRVAAYAGVGVNGTLYVDDGTGFVLIGDLVSDDWFNAGYTIVMECGLTYDYYVVFSDGECDYGTTETGTHTMGNCLYTSIEIVYGDEPTFTWVDVSINATSYPAIVAGISGMAWGNIAGFLSVLNSVDWVGALGFDITWWAFDNGVDTATIYACTSADLDPDGIELIWFDTVANVYSDMTKDCDEMNNLKLREDGELKLREDSGRKQRE